MTRHSNLVRVLGALLLADPPLADVVTAEHVDAAREALVAVGVRTRRGRR